MLHGPQDDQKVLLSLEEQGHYLVCHVAPISLSASLQIVKAGGGRRGQLVLATEVPLQGSQVFSLFRGPSYSVLKKVSKAYK